MEIAVLIHKDEDSVYGVIVPALPGCFSWGDTIDDALKNTLEAVRAHLSTLISEGMPVSLIEVSPDDASTQDDGFWAIVDIDMSGFEQALALVR